MRTSRTNLRLSTQSILFELDRPSGGHMLHNFGLQLTVALFRTCDSLFAEQGHRGPATPQLTRSPPVKPGRSAGEPESSRGWLKFVGHTWDPRSHVCVARPWEPLGHPTCTLRPLIEIFTGLFAIYFGRLGPQVAPMPGQRTISGTRMPPS